MSTFYLLNTTYLGTTKFAAGRLVDDTVDPTTAMAAAGAVLWASSDAIVAAAAANVSNKRKFRGLSDEQADQLMSSAAHGALKATEMQSVTFTITAPVTASPDTNGTVAVIALGTLPAKAFVTGCRVNVGTLFSGGASTSVKLDVGTAAAPTAIVNQMDVFTGAATGDRTGNLGATPDGSYSSVVLQAQLTPDASHKTSGLTAGTATVTVFYEILP